MIIRPEAAADHDAIRRVNDEAFGGTLEGKLVDAIRASDRFVQRLTRSSAGERSTRAKRS